MLKEKIDKWWLKSLHIILDALMFVVPILEIAEVIAVIPYEYLPWYMLGALALRRFVRMLEEYLNARVD